MKDMCTIKHRIAHFLLAAALVGGVGTYGWSQEASEPVLDATQAKQAEAKAAAKEAEKAAKAAEKQQAKQAEAAAKMAEKQAEQAVKQAMKQVEQNMAHVEQNMAHVEQAMSVVNQVMGKNMEHINKQVSQAMKHMPPMPPIPAIPAIPAMPVPPNPGNFRENFKGETVSQTETKAFDANTDTLLSASNSFGSITIVPATDTAQVIVTLDRLTGADTKERAQQLMDTFEVQLEMNDNHVQVEVEIPEEENQNNNQIRTCNIHIRVPDIAGIETENSFGSTNVQGVKADVRVENQFGSVNLVEIEGEANVECQYGNLNVAKQKGVLHIENQFGAVTVDGCASRDVHIENEYGNTVLKGLVPDVVLEADFSFGPVDVHLPANFGGTYEITTSMAPINAPESMMPKEEKKEADEEGGFQMPEIDFDKEIKGRLGQGQGAIKISNEFGPVNLYLEK